MYIAENYMVGEGNDCSRKKVVSYPKIKHKERFANGYVGNSKYEPIGILLNPSSRHGGG